MSISMEAYSIIKKWDEEEVLQHCANELSMIKNFMSFKNPLNFIDIGANVGKFYEELSKTYQINKCYMVEPNPFLNKYIKSKFKNFENVEIFDFAIGYRTGKCDFYNEPIVEGANLGLSRVGHGSGEIDMIEAESFFYDIFLKNDAINLIKIDTENMDYFILDGLCKSMHKLKQKPFILFEHNCEKDEATVEKSKLILYNIARNFGYRELNFEKLLGDIAFYPL